MIGECSFFFKFLALTVRIPLFKRTGHVKKSGLIFRSIEGLSGLPCSRSGRTEKWSSMIHDSASFGYFFKLVAPMMRIPLCKCVGHFKYCRRDVISADSPEKSKESKEIDPSGEEKFAEIGRRSHWPIFFPTSSRVPTGFNGLPRSRSSRSEKRPSMIHEGAFFGYFSHI